MLTNCIGEPNKYLIGEVNVAVGGFGFKFSLQGAVKFGGDFGNNFPCFVDGVVFGDITKIASKSSFAAADCASNAK